MADQASAVSAMAASIEKEFNTLINLMQDLGENGKLTGRATTATGKDGYVADYLGDGKWGYRIGGAEIEIGHFEKDGKTWTPTSKDATNPGTMLSLSTATSNQSVKIGQETDLGMKASQLSKAVSQKVG